jgi:hypothetical protein
MKRRIMLSAKFLRFQAARRAPSAHGTDNPDAIVEFDAMASVLERWTPKAETKRIVKTSRPIESR